MSPDPTAQIAALRVERTYSHHEAAVGSGGKVVGPLWEWRENRSSDHFPARPCCGTGGGNGLGITPVFPHLSDPQFSAHTPSHLYWSQEQPRGPFLRT